MSTETSGQTPPAAAKRVRQSSSQRRASIEAAARTLALTDGLQNLTHRSIAKHLGITHTLVVHHAPDVGEVRARACQVLLEEEYAAMECLVAGRSTAVGRLSALIHALGRPGREEQAGVWFDGWSIGRRDERMARTVRSAMDAWQGFITRILIDGVQRDEFVVDDPQACAWEFIALLDGLNAHTLVAYGDPAEYPARLAAPLAGRLSIPTATLIAAHTEETP